MKRLFTQKNVFKIKVYDDSGVPVFKAKGKKNKVKRELDEFLEFKF